MRTGDAVKDISDAVKGLLSRWANKDGVDVMYHKAEPRIKFKLMTEDKIVIEVDFNINKISKSYIDGMIMCIRETILARRKERHENAIIIT